MPRSAEHLLPQTLTFLVEEQRVCEAEALVALMAQGNGHATWTPALQDSWRAHLRTHVGDFGPHPLFPLLYIRNSQIPRAIRAFESEAKQLAPEQAMSLYLEMLRLFALKRRVPLAAYATKLKRDRVALITQERYAIHRAQLFAAGRAFLASQQWARPLFELAVSTQWVVYPIVREFLADCAIELASTNSTPTWWTAIAVRLASYSDSRAEIETLLPQVASTDMSLEEQTALRTRLEKRIARLADLEAREAARAAADAAYLDSVRAAWLAQLTALPILERSPKAWDEYQDFRDRYTPLAVGESEAILMQLPREATYTVWEVGAILPFEPVKAIKLRSLKTKVRRVNPDETLSWNCPGLEHYAAEEGIGRPIVTHYVVLRLKDQAYALFNLTPPAPGSSVVP